MKYLVIQLCDSSVSFCCYMVKSSPNIIPYKVLEAGLLWGVKRDLSIQVLYPKYPLPYRYLTLLSCYPHVRIASENTIDSDVTVLDGWHSLCGAKSVYSQPVVLHTSVRDFLLHHGELALRLYLFGRLNVVFTDSDAFADKDAVAYEKALHNLSNAILSLYKDGVKPQLNLITDRLTLSGMNNCNAGTDSVTLAPDGNFYPCPAFYLDRGNSIGNPIDGLLVNNRHLYKLDYAPICRICDAYHCKRCVWLNKKLTLEVNTPSHQQCLMAHIERKVAGMLLDRIREYGSFNPNIQIPKLSYYDPFEKLTKKI